MGISDIDDSNRGHLLPIYTPTWERWFRIMCYQEKKPLRVVKIN
jgi:hypothetical protein